MGIMAIFDLMFIYIYLKGGKGGYLSSLGHYPNTRSIQGWVVLKPGTQNTMWIFHMVSRDPST